jgi:hypothetical protein
LLSQAELVCPISIAHLCSTARKTPAHQAQLELADLVSSFSVPLLVLLSVHAMEKPMETCAWQEEQDKASDTEEHVMDSLASVTQNAQALLTARNHLALALEFAQPDKAPAVSSLTLLFVAVMAEITGMLVLPQGQE